MCTLKTKSYPLSSIFYPFPSVFLSFPPTLLTTLDRVSSYSPRFYIGINFSSELFSEFLIFFLQHSHTNITVIYDCIVFVFIHWPIDIVILMTRPRLGIAFQVNVCDFDFFIPCLTSVFFFILRKWSRFKNWHSPESAGKTDPEKC